MVNKSIQRGVVALAASGFLATTFAFTASPAFAGQSNGCDVSVATLLKVSSKDGKPLAGATFRIDSAPNVFLKSGDASGDESKFASAFTSAFSPLSATSAGKAIEAAYLNNLGRNFPGYPSDPTSATGQQQAGAIIQWQNDADGKVAAYEADLSKRLKALTEALNKNPELQTRDTPYYTYLSGEIEKLTRNKDALTIAKTTKVWADFVTSYNTFTDVNNWSYGLAKEPSVVYMDYLNKVSEATYASANSKAAKDISATTSITVTTDSNGKATFTLFGMKYANSDSNTRGDLTCDHLAGKAVEVTAPNGYKLDPTPHSFVSDDKQVITFTVKNTLNTVTPPPSTPSPSTSPTPTTPGGKVDTGAPTTPVNWGLVGGGAAVVAAGGVAVFLVTRRKKDADSKPPTH